jgi:hypothetical protein
MGVDAVETFQKAIRANFECESRLREAVPVRERFQGETIFEGVVHVFDLIGHPTAKLAYVWHAPGKGVYTVLHETPVDSPVAAVRAAIMAGGD